MAKTYPVKVVVTAEDKASGPISAIGRAVNSSLNGLISKSKALAGGIARTTEFLGNLNQARLLVASAVGAGADFIQGLADTGDELGAFADKTGLSVEAIQAWRYAAEQSDVSTEQFNASIEKFAVGIAAAKNGTGPLAAGLKKLSPELLATLKNTTNTEEALRLYIAAMEELPDPAQRALAAGIAFGKGNKDMALLAAKGSDALKALREQKLRDGVVSTEQAKKAGEVDEQLRRLRSQYDGIRASIGGSLLPVLSPLLERLSQWIESNRTLIGLRIEATIQAAGEAFGAMVTWIGKAKDAYDENIAPLIESVGGWGNVLVALFGVQLVAALGSAAVAAGTAAASISAALAPVLLALAAVDELMGKGRTSTAAAGALGNVTDAARSDIATAAYGGMTTEDLARRYAETGNVRVYNALQDRGVQIDTLKQLDAARGMSSFMDPLARGRAVSDAAAATAVDAGRSRARGVEDMFFGAGPQKTEQTVKLQLEPIPGFWARVVPQAGGSASNVTVDTGARQIGTGAP